MSQVSSQKRFIPIAFTVAAAIVLAFGMCCYRSLYHFQRDLYGWPFGFYEVATIYTFSSARGMFLSYSIRPWAVAATFACWCMITFSIWRRCVQKGKWQFGLASAFRWRRAAAVLLWIAMSLDSLWMGPLFVSNFPGWKESLPRSANLDTGSKFVGDLFTRFTCEPIVYLGAFVAIDYYTEALIRAGRYVISYNANCRAKPIEAENL